jgi:hypothetical protein
MIWEEWYEEKEGDYEEQVEGVEEYASPMSIIRLFLVEVEVDKSQRWTIECYKL